MNTYYYSKFSYYLVTEGKFLQKYEPRQSSNLDRKFSLLYIKIYQMVNSMIDVLENVKRICENTGVNNKIRRNGIEMRYGPKNHYSEN